jgi:hypothetical protein
MESDMVFIAGNLLLLISEPMTDEEGHQLSNYEYPGLNRQEIVRAVEDFYAHCYFRPRIIFRIKRYFA